MAIAYMTHKKITLNYKNFSELNGYSCVVCQVLETYPVTLYLTWK